VELATSQGVAMQVDGRATEDVAGPADPEAVEAVSAVLAAAEVEARVAETIDAAVAEDAAAMTERQGQALAIAW
jgi:hypothetical protein